MSQTNISECIYWGNNARNIKNRTNKPNIVYHKPSPCTYTVRVYRCSKSNYTQAIAACHVAAMLSSDFHGWAFLHCITFVYTVRAVLHSYTHTRPPLIRCDSVPNCTLSAREGRLEATQHQMNRHTPK